MTYFLKIKTFVFPVLTLLWRFAPQGNLPCSDELFRCPFSHERFPCSVVAIYNHFALRNPDRPIFLMVYFVMLSLFALASTTVTYLDLLQFSW